MKRKGFWQTMLDIINDANESVKKWQIEIVEKKLDKIAKKEAKKAKQEPL